MWKSTLLLIFFGAYCLGGPLGLKKNMPINQQRETPAVKEIETSSAEVTTPDMMIISTLNLPSNATSIRADITDGFSCRNRTYGYYADVDNDCQIFHVCLPVSYADGKESTFRWSFICPEETVFSQDSFTCMRPEDMVITCEESFKYYELNRNFGIVENELEQSIENEPINFAENQQSVVMSTKPESIPEAQTIITADDESKPVNIPVKVQKPNRRKPGSPFVTQKRPNTPSQYPLRKLPPAQGVISDAVAELDSANLHEEEPVKSTTIQKFSRRPLPSTTLKDKTSPSYSESTIALRTELYNQKRKRPTLFNKKDTVTPIDTDTALIPQPPRIEKPIQNFSKVESELPHANAPAEMADSDSQASENKEIFVKPAFMESSKASDGVLMVEEPQIIEHEINSEEIKESPLEVTANIPVIIEESENAKVIGDLESIKVEKQNDAGVQASESIQTFNENYRPGENLDEDLSHTASAEGAEYFGDQISEFIRPSPDTRIKDSLHPAEPQTAIDIQSSNESEAVGDTQIPEQTHVTIETTPTDENQLKTIKDSLLPAQQASNEIGADAISPMVSQNQPVVEDLSSDVEETQPSEGAQIVEEIPQSLEEIRIDEHEFAGPTREEEEENSEESSIPIQSQTVEEMEAEKPDEAPDSMPATPEMAQQDPLVQQMFEEKTNIDTSKQSMAGFKPADPVMAAEAEKLIVDFINALRKADTDVTQVSDSAQMEDEIIKSQEDERDNEGEDETEVKKVIKDETPDLHEHENIDTSQDLDKSAETGNIQEIVKNVSTAEVSVENDVPLNESEISEEEKMKSENEASEEIMSESGQSVALKALEDHNSEAAYMESEQLDQQQSKIDNPVEQDIQDTPVDEDSTVPEKEEIRENEVVSVISSVDSVEETEVEPDDSQSHFTNGYKPLSIDDIVELVKERLDHMPKNEMETPMRLDQVLSNINEEKEEEDEEPHENNGEEQKQNLEIQSGEDIVMPIYHRVANDQTIAQAMNAEPIIKMDQTNQNDNEGSMESGLNSISEADLQLKTNRPYRSRSMLEPILDTRKRRFLFKSDAS
uniref:Chitin-binding type-2 domain-containing protein n=1 Tax=Glossina austeni TaxID=7395 RepID=A0A1A9V546_GLOAU